MTESLQVLAIVLAAITLALPLAHALEMPGKLRLSKEEYLVVQPIYYPGFTIGGIAEPALLLALVVLAFLVPPGAADFWLTLASLAVLTIMHAAYWVLTHPVNNFWLKDTKLETAGAAFFNLGTPAATSSWTKLRDRWEISHAVRAGLGFAAFVLLAIAAVT
jgi:hypothetical protein